MVYRTTRRLHKLRSSLQVAAPAAATAVSAVLLLLGVAVAASACQSDEDCLLLGTCQQGVCHCRQGFTGPECGQLDLTPAPTHLGYRNLTASTWGGLPVKVKGKWHMYVSMMRGGCPLGTFNNNSEIAHLVSVGTDWKGPYAFEGTVISAFAHNAAPRILADGSVGIWFIGYDGHVDAITCPGGVPPQNYVWPDWSGKQIAMAKSPPGQPAGPWNVSWLFELPQLPQDWWHWDCSSSNPSAVVVADDGAVHMMYRGTMCTHCDGCPGRPANASERLGIATAPAVTGPYTHAPAAIDLGGNSVEDPFYWRGASGSHHLIAHSGSACRDSPHGGNWCGVIASSADGATWRLAAEPAYGPNVTLTNGTIVRLFARQRPQLIFDASSADSVDAPLLAIVNGAELADGTVSLMQGSSFTLIQPVRER